MNEKFATEAQWSYVRRLMNEAFSHNYKRTPNIDVHHRPRIYTMSMASADIKNLLEAKKNNWRRHDPEPSEDSIERNEIRKRERIAEANEY